MATTTGSKLPAPPTQEEIKKSFDNIEAYIKTYKKDFDMFKVAANQIEENIRGMLAEKKMPAIVSSRAKDPERLKQKLINRVNDTSPDRKSYLQIGAIEEDIVDIVGTRVVLYLSHDAETAANEIVRLLIAKDTTYNLKAIKDSQIGPTDLLTKLSNESVMKTLGDLTLPANYTPQKEDYKAQLGSYRAAHIRMSLAADAFVDSLKTNLANAGRSVKVEIQVQGLLMHAWSEVSHDVLYKPMAGKLSNEEYKLLDCLNGIGKLGEAVLVKLTKLTNARQNGTIKPSSTDPTSSYEQKYNLDSKEVTDNIIVFPKGSKDPTWLKKLDESKILLFEMLS